MVAKEVFKIGRTYCCKWHNGYNGYFINTIKEISHLGPNDYLIGTCSYPKDADPHFEINAHTDVTKEVIVELTKPFTKQNYPEYFI